MERPAGIAQDARSGGDRCPGHLEKSGSAGRRLKGELPDVRLLQHSVDKLTDKELLRLW